MIDERIPHAAAEWLHRNPMLSASRVTPTPTMLKNDVAMGQGSPLNPTSPIQDRMDPLGDTYPFLPSIVGNAMPDDNFHNSDMDWNTPDDLACSFIPNNGNINDLNSVSESPKRTDSDRTRMYSGSWAPSPYSELEDLHMSPLPAASQQNFSSFPINKNLDVAPCMGRQTSLSMAIEVLGNAGMEDTDLPDSPISTPFTDGNEYLLHPSPSYSQFEGPSSSVARHRNISWPSDLSQAAMHSDTNRARSASEDATAHQNYEVDIEALLQETFAAVGCSAAESQSEANTNSNNNSVVSTTNEETCSTTTAAAVSDSYTISESTSAPQQTLLIDSLLNNLHVPQQEVLTPSNVTCIVVESTVEISDIQEELNDEAQAETIDLTSEAPSTSTMTFPEMTRTPSYTRKRTRNNAACKVSRKKKKTQQMEAEEKVERLATENVDLRKMIANLEVEVKKTRETLLQRMTGKKPAAN